VEKALKGSEREGAVVRWCRTNFSNHLVTF